MTVTKRKFVCMKRKYGTFSSWAVWGAIGDRPKSNMECLRMFEEPQLSATTIGLLRSSVVLVSLNPSTIDLSTQEPLSNFHGTNGEVYKLRYAIHDHPKVRGAYMTDVIKTVCEPDAAAMMARLDSDRCIEKENIGIFRDELRELSVSGGTLVALGRNTEAILRRNGWPNKSWGLVRINHYGWRAPKEKYRQAVLKSLRCL